MGRLKKGQTLYSPPEFKKSLKRKAVTPVSRKLSTKAKLRAEEETNISEEESNSPSQVEPADEMVGEETGSQTGRLKKGQTLHSPPEFKWSLRRKTSTKAKFRAEEEANISEENPNSPMQVEPADELAGEETGSLSQLSGAEEEANISEEEPISPLQVEPADELPGEETDPLSQLFGAEEEANISDEHPNSPLQVQPADELAGEETGPLSRLRQYPQKSTPNNTNTEPSQTLRKQYASTAESVKKLFIADLTSRNDSSVEEMVDLANNFFTTLDFLHAEYSDLYIVVRDFISYHCQYSVAKKKLESNQNDALHHRNLYVRLNEAADALFKAEAERFSADQHLCSVRTEIAKTREVLKKLKTEHAQGERDVLSLEKTRLECESSFEFTKRAESEFVGMMEENLKCDGPTKRQYDEAEAGIERSIMALWSLCVNTDQ